VQPAIRPVRHGFPSPPLDYRSQASKGEWTLLPPSPGVETVNGTRQPLTVNPLVYRREKMIPIPDVVRVANEIGYREFARWPRLLSQL
jgi:hypothetical protein